ncbi:bifunctional (p)ppGpp synthetase/guanosine-3',5'-bis(diphosphate) 3'-pyrophosphohydrolase [Candidatus Gracilibacteria bacterium 28_42_T64]|nr:bifunctional (p)ppGpp synthetase/guanosine-3',5'-bis(diphosphate) 3'-pyrophosphohydrolase [Candidatus Gracilibacteria bacterium 28_42_T64]
MKGLNTFHFFMETSGLGHQMELFLDYTTLEKEVDSFLNEIEKKSGLTISAEEKRKIKDVYFLAYKAHNSEKRKDGTPYFDHPKRVALLLSNFEGVNIKQIIIALLHDVIENTDIEHDFINKLFGEDIADGVQHLSKKDWKDYIYDIDNKYLSSQEKSYINKRKVQRDNLLKRLNSKYTYEEESEKLKQIIISGDELETNKGISKNIKHHAKKLRDREYFGGMIELDDDELFPKLIDRVDNLATLEGYSNDKVTEVINHTINYFLPVARQRNLPICLIMIKQINKLITNRNLKIRTIRSIKNALFVSQETKHLVNNILSHSTNLVQSSKLKAA